jgi:hypothetical protein
MGVTLLEKIKPSSYKIHQNSKNSMFCVFLKEMMGWLEKGKKSTFVFGNPECDGEVTFFGYVYLNGMKEFAEWGYISLKELKELRVEQPILINGESGMVLLQIECDKYWKIRKAIDVPFIT